MRGVANVPTNHLDEERIALRGPNRRQVANDPEHQAGDPQSQSKADRGRKRSVHYRGRARGTGEQDRFGEGPVHRRLEAGDHVVSNDFLHQMSAPPANEKNDRKNDEVAKAMDRPKTTYISRR